MSFEWAIRAEFATQHLMHEAEISGPVDFYLDQAYKLQMENPEKWDAIQKAYELDIQRCLKRGIGDRRRFKYRSLAIPQSRKDEGQDG
ncbi:hypothetical protein EKK58_08630 [Candidatus Dependentiae bacterium]|nr:MAG: hypothetical protein EKK58_08630 [Candidatus Dependentiae bacterium]